MLRLAVYFLLVFFALAHSASTAAATVADISARALQNEFTELKCRELLKLVEGRALPYGKSINFKGQFRLEDAYLADAEKSVLDLIPPHLEALTGTFPVEGCDVNCYRSAMLWFFPSMPLKSLTFLDFSTQVGRNFDPLGESSDVQFGDLLVYRGESTIHHAAIFLGVGLNDYIVWHKGSADHRDPWTLEGLRDASREYRNSNHSLRVYRHKTQ